MTVRLHKRLKITEAEYDRLQNVGVVNAYRIVKKGELLIPLYGIIRGTLLPYPVGEQVTVTDGVRPKLICEYLWNDRDFVPTPNAKYLAYSVYDRDGLLQMYRTKELKKNQKKGIVWAIGIRRKNLMPSSTE